jgi:hypothetical protein
MIPREFTGRIECYVIGSVPYTLRAKWKDADEFIDEEGNALDIRE